MHVHIKPMSLAAGLGIVATLGLAGLVQGQTLSSGQNTAVFSLPNNAAYLPTDGLNTLTRNDPPTPADHIQDVNQWTMFYRVGAGTNESVGQLFLRFSGTQDKNGDGKPDQISATWASDNTSNGFTTFPNLAITLTSGLVGSGSPTNASFQSTITRTMTVQSNFASATDIHLFSFTNLKPTMVESPTAAGVYTQDIGPTFAQQIGRNVRVWQDTTGGQLITDTRTDSDALNLPSRYEIAADANAIAALIAKLNGGTTDLANTFSSANGPIIPGPVGSLTATASLAYALQYDILGATAGSTYIANETLTITPEPASLALLAIGGTMIMMRRRRTA